MKASSFAVILAFGTLGLLSACGGSSEPPAAPPAPPAPAAPETPAAAAAPAATDASAASAAPAAEPPKAEPRTLDVNIEAKSGSKLTGKATLTEVDGGVKVVLSVEGVKPGGDHGAHVHEKGDCSAADGASAGGHFNPQGNDHALPTVAKRHLGDLGNLTIAKDGKGTLEITIPGANLKAGDPNSFAGKSIIVHAKKDDGGQPTGNAGGRIGCGVIPS
ncbi:MAG TPA: superoxide dismutase family protein [Polyangiaceae bacterium]|nr:superoxide dismutase family protein [Polyangiaceae bacterium]